MPSPEDEFILEERKEAFKQNESEFCSKYEQKNQISNGAFSSVFCIKQLKKKTRVLYAAKYLKANREATKREVEILVKLRRCNQVVTLIEVFQCQFYTILVTEYLPGGDLFERLSAPDYHLTEEKCQLFIRQIVQGMDFIHTTNIIHLDVKPFNILFANKAGLTLTAVIIHKPSNTWHLPDTLHISEAQPQLVLLKHRICQHSLCTELIKSCLEKDSFDVFHGQIGNRQMFV